MFTEAMAAGVVVEMVDVQMRKEKLTVGGEYPGRCTLLQAGICVLSKTSAPGVKHLANDHANQNIPVSCTPFPFAVQGATSQSWWSSLRMPSNCVAEHIEHSRFEKGPMGAVAFARKARTDRGDKIDKTIFDQDT